MDGVNRASPPESSNTLGGKKRGKSHQDGLRDGSSGATGVPFVSVRTIKHCGGEPAV